MGAEGLASGRLLVECSPRTQLAVDCPEREACQQSGGRADVDCQHQIDPTGVLHLDLGGDELSRSFMQEGERRCPEDDIDGMEDEQGDKFL